MIGRDFPEQKLLTVVCFWVDLTCFHEHYFNTFKIKGFFFLSFKNLYLYLINSLETACSQGHSDRESKE